METIIDLITIDITGILVQSFFAFTIILMVVDKQKPPVMTGVLTGIALIVLGLGGSFYSPIVMGLSILNGGLWLFLAWQRYNQKSFDVVTQEVL